jgi:hypothetical protein
MKLRLPGIALPWLALVVLLPALALSLTAGTVRAGCPCSGSDSSPATATISIDVSPQGAGDVKIGGSPPPSYPVVRTMAFSGTIHIEASPAEGYYFVGWSGDLSGDQNPIYVNLDADKTITACFFPEEIASEDNRLHLVFTAGTVVQGGDGTPLGGLEIAIDETPLPSPPEAGIVGLPYTLGPQGTTFDQPVSLNFSYDPWLIPPRVAEEELVMGYYDEATAQWLVLPSVVDMDSHIISAPIDHLSTFAVIAPNPPPLPAAFSTSALNISPLETDIGEAVTISVLVTNTGEEEGSYSLALAVNGVLAETREITMPGGSQEVVFSTSGDEAGSYTVEVNGLEGSFTVLEAPLLPVALPAAVIWIILGLAIAALLVAAVITPILSLR